MTKKSFKNLQVGDNDLIGNKFNGFDLHLYLRKNGIDSNHLVWNKDSNDKHTFVLVGDRNDRLDIRLIAEKINTDYCLDQLCYPFLLDVLYNKLFLESDLVHLHLIHNYIGDIRLLPILSRLKPIVWSIHDPWPVSGHCIEHFECEKWIIGCGDCPNLSTPFALQKDNTALNYEIKKESIQNSDIDIILASDYMKKKLEKSEIFKDKRLHVIPYGVNHDIFKPVDKKEIRLKLGIPEDAYIFSFRGDNNCKKGLDYIEYVAKNLNSDKKVFFLVFGGNYFSENKTEFKFPYKEYGWIKDDYLMSDIYNASDLFLMPSLVESFGMMAAEAMSCGVLPIVLDNTALPDVVNAPDCGVSVIRDKEKFLETIEYFMINDEERLSRGLKCLKFARKKYSKDLYTKRIISVYEKAIRRHKLSDRYSYILKQLKKYMVIKPLLKKLPDNGNFREYETLKSQNKMLINNLEELKNTNSNLVSIIDAYKNTKLFRYSDKIKKILLKFGIKKFKL
jgi:glycosyltransferase involved in cell wall biosynthesis